MKTILNKIYYTIFPASVKRLINLYRWEYPKFKTSIWSQKSKKHRLLIIHDFCAQPFSIGEMIVSLEGALILREQYGADKIDVAILYDRKNPVVDQSHKKITEENILFNLSAIIPVVQVNPYIGSVFIFDYRIHLERFILDNINYYTVWPKASSFKKRKYVYYEVMNQILYPYFKKNGYIPTLSCIPPLKNWALGFYKEHICPQIPITIQIRNNPFFHQWRNLNIECWIKFLKFCIDKYPAKFVLIGTPNEMDERFRELDNVIVAKDFHTGIDQDLSLIQLSAIHMGASSGPGCMAWFNTKPFLMVRQMIEEKLHRGLIKDGAFVRYSFSTPHQLLYTGEENCELLISQFERMWNEIDVKTWSKITKESSNTEILSWLR